MNATALHSPSLTAPAAAGADHPVLVATTGRNGGAALKAAQRIAASRGAPVVALSVVEPPVTALSDPGFGYIADEYESVRVASRRSAVERQIAGLAGPGAPWETAIRVGTPDSVIADEARDRDAGLIVMDSGRHNWVARLLLGETTLRTMRWAHCPVLAVGASFDDLPRVAVAAIDFSPSSIAAARAALAVLNADATLYLVHVWQRSPSDHPSEMARDASYERGLGGMFERLVSSLGVPPNVTVRTLSMLGEPAAEILSFAASQGADLIVAGRRGRGFFERLLIGSVTSALVRGAECAVFVAPDPPLAEAEGLARVVTGVFESRAPNDWAAELDRFTRRNQGRRVVLESDDPTVGRRVHVRGYAFRGAAYDHRDGRVDLMFGDLGAATGHLTHSVAGVKSVGVRADADGTDEALLVTHAHGWAMLTFAPGNRTLEAE